LLPARIGKYEILGKLGQGAMGEVFRARDPVLNREVAVKRITAGLDVDETVRRRFRREAEAAAKLAHPNIITVYEAGLEGEQLYLAMELLDGVDLKHALAARAMSLDEKLAVALQVCEGVALAHSNEIVHRDLKPANIHILPSGKVKILDFGLARFSGSEMTSTGMVMGTPHYMSPEQVRGLRADARSDVFALGCVFYEMLSGRKPFDAESMHGVLFKIMQEDPVPLGEAAPGTPEPIAHVVEKALAKDPADRYANATDLLAALRQARKALGTRSSARLDHSVRAPAAPPPARKAVERGTHSSRSAPRSPPQAAPRWALAAALALGFAVVALGGWALRRIVLAPPPPPAASAPGLDGLARKAVDSQVELARRRLEAGLYAEAIGEAQQALRLDPGNAAARQIVEEAGRPGGRSRLPASGRGGTPARPGRPPPGGERGLERHRRLRDRRRPVRGGGRGIEVGTGSGRRAPVPGRAARLRAGPRGRTLSPVASPSPPPAPAHPC
jgi:tRNA A-37 threonylcarbamoyl transferase component Bud32